MPSVIHASVPVGRRAAGRSRLPTAGSAGGHSRQPDQQVEDVVLGVDREDAEDRVPIAHDESPGGDDQIDDAEAERVCSGRIGARSVRGQP
jgi:hypothetical protein